MIGTRCNRKSSGLKGNDAVKDHVAENGNNTSQSVKKPKDDFIFPQRAAMPKAINTTLQKDGLPRMFDTPTGTGRKWDNSNRSSRDDAGTTKAMSKYERSLQLLR